MAEVKQTILGIEERCEVLCGVSFKSVCLFVCLSVRSHISETNDHTPNLTKFVCMLPVAVSRSFSDGVATVGLHYVLPVLWMTSCFYIMALWRVMCIPKRR